MKKKHLRTLEILLCTLLLLCVLAPLTAQAVPPDHCTEMHVGENDWTEYVDNYMPLPKETGSESTGYSGLSESDLDLMANVVAHEVGGISGEGTYVVITYADGTTQTYNGGCILHKLHARVLLNQIQSDIFPSSASACISTYWASWLASPGCYSRSSSLWQHCRQDVVDAVSGGFSIPSNVYAATCDAWFASWYPGYTLYASVYWNTGWYSGVLYYYSYGG